MVWPRGWGCCSADHVSCGARVFLNQESKACAWPGRRIGWTRPLRIPTSDKNEGEERREQEEQEEEETQAFGGGAGAKIQRSKIIRPIRFLPRCLRGRRGSSSASSSPDRGSVEAPQNFLKTIFAHFRKPRQPPPRVLTPPAIFVSSPEETEAVVAMDAHARRHRSRRASELYNVESEDDLDFLPEEPYPGMYKDRFFGGTFEEGWTTVGEATIDMDRRSPEPRKDRSHDPPTRRSPDPHTERSYDPRTGYSSDPRLDRSPGPRTNRSPDPRTERSYDPNTRRSSEPRMERSLDHCTRAASDPRMERSLDHCTERSSNGRSQATKSPTDKPKVKSSSHKSPISKSPACRSTAQTHPSNTYSARTSPENISSTTKTSPNQSPNKLQFSSPLKGRASPVSDSPNIYVEEPLHDTPRSPKKTNTSWRSPFSSPKKAHNNKLAQAMVESSPKMSPKNSPKTSPKNAKGIAGSNSPVAPRRVLPEILESSVQQYRPVYHTPPLGNSNLVPKPYSSKYSTTTPPFRGPVASPRTVLSKAEAAPCVAEGHEDKVESVSPKIPKDTKGKVKKSVRSDADQPASTDRTFPATSTRSTTPTEPINPKKSTEKWSPDLRTNRVRNPTRSKTPSPIASPSRSSPSSPIPSPPTVPDASPALTPPSSPPSSPEADDLSSGNSDLDPEEFLALSTLDSALLETQQSPSLYNCPNEPFNSYGELQTMTQESPPRSPSPAPHAASLSRPSSRTKTSEYSGDIDSSGSRRTSECLDTTLSRDSLNNCDEIKSLRSFVAQEELPSPSSPRNLGGQREESVEFMFEEVKDSPVRGQRESAKVSGGDTVAAGEKKANRLSPNFGKFTQKVSDKNKENEDKSKTSSFLPLNILHFGSKDKKAKAKTSETDSPKSEGWTSEAIENYLLQSSREESVKLGLLTEEDIVYHEAAAAGSQRPAPRPPPEVTISDDLHAPAALSRRRAAPDPPRNKSPSWRPEDIENYLLQHNMDENLRLGLLSKEDIEIYEWKRATGMSPICDTSWTRETLRKNKVVYSSDSSVSGSTPASPDPSFSPPRRGSPSLMPPPSRRRAPKEPQQPVEKAIDVPSQPLTVPRRRVRAPAPPIGTPPTHDSALSSGASASETSKAAGHFAFRGFKLGQRVGSGKSSAPQPPAGAGLKHEAAKPPAEATNTEDVRAGGMRALFTKPKLISPSTPKAAAPTPGVITPRPATSQAMYQGPVKPEVSKGRGSCPGVSKPLSRPRRLPLEKIGVKLPGMTGPATPPTPPPEEDIETVSVASVSPDGTPNQKRKGKTGDRAPRKKTPYGMLARFLRKDPTPSPTAPAEVPVHALFMRESPRGPGAAAVTDEDEGGVRKRLSDMKLRLGCLRRRGDSQGSVRPMPEEVQGWAESFHKLMASKYGQALFKAFLQREFSEENVEFWLAVEDFKKTRAAKMPSKASKIHSDYVAVQAPKELNLDPGTRAQIAKSLDCPDKYIFDAAQKRVQALMESDAYLRFLQSDLYKELLHPETSMPKSEAL